MVVYDGHDGLAARGKQIIRGEVEIRIEFSCAPTKQPTPNFLPKPARTGNLANEWDDLYEFVLTKRLFPALNGLDSRPISPKKQVKFGIR